MVTQNIQTTLNIGHACGSITVRVKVVKTEKKGKRLNTLEKCHICKMSKNGIHMNNACIDAYNPIFEALQEVNTRQQYI
jgi:transcription elongation factor Elf1